MSDLCTTLHCKRLISANTSLSHIQSASEGALSPTTQEEAQWPCRCQLIAISSSETWSRLVPSAEDRCGPAELQNSSMPMTFKWPWKTFVSDPSLTRCYPVVAQGENKSHMWRISVSTGCGKTSMTSPRCRWEMPRQIHSWDAPMLKVRAAHWSQTGGSVFPMGEAQHENRHCWINMHKVHLLF